MAYNFTVVLVLALLALVVVIGGLVVQYFTAPRRHLDSKSMVYECGELPIGGAWFNFNPRFYIIALIFLIFDVEIAFTFPIGVVYKQWMTRPDWYIAFFEVALFMVVLLIGLAYVWRKGDLEWIRKLWDDSDIQASHLEKRS